MAELIVRQEQTVLEAAEAVPEKTMAMWVKMGEMA
jgi:hypothetical protein